jgi:hypothetical protein
MRSWNFLGLHQPRLLVQLSPKGRLLSRSAISCGSLDPAKNLPTTIPAAGRAAELRRDAIPMNFDINQGVSGGLSRG